MKKLRIKYLLTVICMLAAGICYSCGKGTNQVDLDGQTLVMDLQAEQTSQEAGVQSGLISAKTEAGRSRCLCRQNRSFSMYIFAGKW